MNVQEGAQTFIEKLESFGKSLGLKANGLGNNINALVSKAKSKLSDGIKLLGNFIEKNTDQVKNEFIHIENYVKSKVSQGGSALKEHAENIFAWIKQKGILGVIKSFLNEGVYGVLVIICVIFLVVYIIYSIFKYGYNMITDNRNRLYRKVYQMQNQKISQQEINNFSKESYQVVKKLSESGKNMDTNISYLTKFIRAAQKIVSIAVSVYFVLSIIMLGVLILIVTAVFYALGNQVA